MALNWQPPAGGNYDDIMYAYLKAMEGDTMAPVLVNGNPTIGVGFDLVAGGATVQNEVLIGLGLKEEIVRATQAQAAAFVPGSWQAIEYGYVQQLRVNMGNINALNQIMKARANDTNPQFVANVLNRRSSFAFANDTEVRAVYDQLLPHYEQFVFNQYPALQNDTGYLTSRERMVLTDLAWNGGTGLLGQKLGDAIATGNRAEAWYQIRYKSNGGSSASNGIAKRRYYESEVFGLYSLYNSGDSAASLDEATQVYQMFTTHRPDILDYEAKYGSQVTAANSDYHLSGTSSVLSLQDELRSAADLLMQEYGHGRTDFDPRNIQMADDTLTVLTGENDTTNTGSKDDLLIGSKAHANELYGYDGNDILIGGGFNDV